MLFYGKSLDSLIPVFGSDQWFARDGITMRIGKSVEDFGRLSVPLQYYQRQMIYVLRVECTLCFICAVSHFTANRTFLTFLHFFPRYPFYITTSR